MLDTSSLTLPSGSAGRSGATSQTVRARENVSKQQQDFLMLLTTQLQNQDPTQPMDVNQMTQQIATLSQVEQQINTNKNLEQLITMFNATQYNSVVSSYLGNQIEAVGNQGALESGHGLFMYYLSAEAETCDITIKDSTGAVVYTGEGPKADGRNEFIWDGKDNNGNDLEDGIYTIEVKAKDASHNDLTAQTYTTGVVTSIDSVNGTVYASIGSILSVPLTNIISVRQPTTPGT
jgi:flagellar basal-body rod modification protein FlgD